MKRHALLLLAFASVGCGGMLADTRNDNSGPWAGYIGRYKLSSDLVLDVKLEDDLLVLLPSFWRTPLILDPRGENTFASLLHPEVGFEFILGGDGLAISLEVSGHREIEGLAHRLPDEDYLPVEHLLGGDGPKALARLDAEGGVKDPDRAIALGFNLVKNFPSRAKAAATFLSGLEARFPESSDLHEAMAHAWMLAGSRDLATESLHKLSRLDPENRFAQRALRHLDPGAATPPPPDAWRLPFSLDDLFKAPSKEEIAAVRRDWASRQLHATNVEEEVEQSLVLAERRFEVRVLSHTVHGERHYGAVLVPEGAAPGCCPVVLELHGVSADYSPFDIGRARVPKILQEDLSRVILALPAFRGETLIVGDRTYTSAGSPTRAWDGAADDALAFMEVVFKQIPEAKPARTCVFGKSRGGTVALLTGARDRRVGCVVNWAGPAEWFGRMGTFGWSLREQVEWALWERWKPGEGWGASDQFVDWFLSEPIANGAPGLSPTRLEILASSPLYFLETLPSTLMHYGGEDRSVPVANAVALRQAVAAKRGPAAPLEVHIHDGAGHDMPYPLAHRATRTYLLRRLFDEQERH